MTIIIFVLLIISFLFGNIVKFSFFSPEINFSLLDVSVFVFNLIYISRNIKKKITPHILSICLFTVIALLSLVLALSKFGSSEIFIGFLYLARWLNYTLVFLFLSTYLTSHKSHSLILTLGLMTVFGGFIQYFFLPDVRFLALDNWDPHYYRIIGSLLDPGFTGLIYVFTLIYLTFHPFKSNLNNIISWGLTYLALALTYSRSSYLAFIVAMAGLSLFQRQWRLLFFSGLLLFCTLQLLPNASGGEGVNLGRTSTIEARIRNWQHSLIIWRDHPLLGVGFNTYRYAQRDYGFLNKSNWLQNHAGAGADSSLLFILATTGLIGLLAYLTYLRSIFNLSDSKHELATIIIALLTHSFFLNSLFYPFVLVWLSLVVAKEYRSLSAQSQSYSPSGR